MPRVFIAYRRNDTGGYAGRVYDRLVARWGKRRITRDMEGIPPGIAFSEYVRGKIAESDCVLVLIGEQWMAAANRERLHDPADLHRVEIETALGSGNRVIPVLINGAPMPSKGELPPGIQGLADRNAFHLGEDAWNDDVRRLVREIERFSVVPRWRWTGLGMAGAALITWLGATQFRAPDDDTPNSGSADSVLTSAVDTGISSAADTAAPVMQNELADSGSAAGVAAVPDAPSPPAGTCLPYEPARVTITGRLERRLYYGPPGFGETPAVDQQEVGFYVIPDNPLCTFNQDGMFNGATSGVELVQMVLDSAGYANARPHLNSRVRAKGTLFGELSGHHHAPLLLTAETIEPAYGGG